MLREGEWEGIKAHWSSNLPDFATLHNFSGGGDLASLQFVPFSWACCRAAGYHNRVCVRGMRRRYNDGDEDDGHKRGGGCELKKEDNRDGKAEKDVDEVPGKVQVPAF